MVHYTASPARTMDTTTSHAQLTAHSLKQAAIHKLSLTGHPHTHMPDSNISRASHTLSKRTNLMESVSPWLSSTPAPVVGRLLEPSTSKCLKSVFMDRFCRPRRSCLSPEPNRASHSHPHGKRCWVVARVGRSNALQLQAERPLLEHDLNFSLHTSAKTGRRALFV